MHLLKVRRSTRIQPRSRDNGPASADTAQIPRQWTIVPRYGQIPRQRAIVRRYGSEWTSARFALELTLRHRSFRNAKLDGGTPPYEQLAAASSATAPTAAGPSEILGPAVRRKGQRRVSPWGTKTSGRIFASKRRRTPLRVSPRAAASMASAASLPALLM